jgi:hypothetical protein
MRLSHYSHYASFASEVRFVCNHLPMARTSFVTFGASAQAARTRSWKQAAVEAVDTESITSSVSSHVILMLYIISL